ncbi:MAG: hypothetical protein AAGH17_07220 [Pseudomonadota bacterium]
MTGFIELDSLGSGLDGSNITNWSLTLNSTNYANTVLDPSNGEILDIGTYSLTATATELTLFMPSATDTEFGIFAFVDTLAFPYALSVQWQGGDGTPPEIILSNAPRTGSRAPFDQAFSDIDPAGFLIGTRDTPQVVPLPASLPLLLAALASGAALSRRKRRLSS